MALRAPPSLGGTAMGTVTPASRSSVGHLCRGRGRPDRRLAPFEARAGVGRRDFLRLGPLRGTPRRWRPPRRRKREARCWDRCAPITTPGGRGNSVAGRFSCAARMNEIHAGSAAVAPCSRGAERARVVVARPRRAHDVGRVADEPSVLGLVAGARLAGDRASEALAPRGRCRDRRPTMSRLVIRYASASPITRRDGGRGGSGMSAPSGPAMRVTSTGASYTPPAANVAYAAAISQGRDLVRAERERRDRRRASTECRARWPTMTTLAGPTSWSTCTAATFTLCASASRRRIGALPSLSSKLLGRYPCSVPGLVSRIVAGVKRRA